MPSFIVKINPDDDLYVYWSEVVDAPLFMGNRMETEHYLTHEANNCSTDLAASARFDRADSTGTSSREGVYAWGDDEFMVGADDVVMRRDVPELVRCMAEDRPYQHLVR